MSAQSNIYSSYSRTRYTIKQAECQAKNTPKTLIRALISVQQQRFTRHKRVARALRMDAGG
ncbi:protein of unknown function [Candidatus Methylomirabilis oxygeniifera]|uniref:Uncharacterized protein n=1 Tax=Methylomirabilis oxygeniifera TaxID=671143 RepID=D5MGE0_METO1|nr:protein of unknown function [Candidatus Methylomirabilis oxyfera]